LTHGGHKTKIRARFVGEALI